MSGLRSIASSLKRKITLLKHSGNKYHCPFCGFDASHLQLVGLDLPVLKRLHIIGGGRREGGCFKCGSSDRERLIYAFLFEEKKIQSNRKNLSILHIAPERNLTKHMLGQGFKEYVCGDLFTEGYTYAAHVQNMNLLDLKVGENRFDIFICNHVLEHIPDDAKAMKAIYAALKPGGFAILQVPISANSAKTYEDFSIQDPEGREREFGQFDHVRVYGQDYAERLSACGFKVERINISAKYPKAGTNPEEDLYIAHK